MSLLLVFVVRVRQPMVGPERSSPMWFPPYHHTLADQCCCQCVCTRVCLWLVFVVGCCCSSSDFVVVLLPSCYFPPLEIIAPAIMFVMWGKRARSCSPGGHQSSPFRSLSASMHGRLSPSSSIPSPIHHPWIAYPLLLPFLICSWTCADGAWLVVDGGTTPRL